MNTSFDQAVSEYASLEAAGRRALAKACPQLTSGEIAPELRELVTETFLAAFSAGAAFAMQRAIAIVGEQELMRMPPSERPS